ncbi:hypothetical protein [Orientia tsutsugamushi]|uniref:hypothetical protein n=1 Tax=Orientia tsutsugamushi TaxID=784 RepID=UPI004046ECB8
MPEIKLNLKANLLRLFRYLSAIILNYLNQFRKKSIVSSVSPLFFIQIANVLLRSCIVHSVFRLFFES